jgi:hypothetical protein
MDVQWCDEERRHVGSLDAEESGNTAWSRRQVGSLSICLNTAAYENNGLPGIRIGCLML